MIKVFLDTSVLLAACKSKGGGSSYIFMLCRKGLIQGIISRYVVYEAKKNATRLLNQHEKQRLNFLLLQCKIQIMNAPEERDIQKYEAFIEKKDSPIVASAVSIQADYLLSLNVKDFMKAELSSAIRPVKIATPKDFIMLYSLK